MAESTTAKRCPACAATKPPDQYGKNRATKDGLATYCRPCARAKNKESIARRGGTRHYHLTARYGITEAEVQGLIEIQGGVCAICRTNPPSHLDHDHASGTVRGVLCVPCNNGLGLFRDDADLMHRASLYLRWSA